MDAKAKVKRGELFSTLSMPVLLVILIVFFSIMSPRFLSPLNLTNILVQNVHVAIVAAAVMIIMISGGCDLSIGYQMSVAAVLVTKMLSVYNVPVFIAVIAGIALCSLLGTFNGIMAIKLKSNTMIVTLATMSVFQGISYLISESKTCMGIGRKVYAAGDSPEAARLAGLPVAKIKVLSFTCAGILVGIAAVLLASRSGSADSGTGVGIEFTGITACVLSGVALKGGEGTLWKVIVAAFVLGVLSNGMQLINLGTYPQYIAKGVIMLLSLYLTNRNAQGM